MQGIFHPRRKNSNTKSPNVSKEQVLFDELNLAKTTNPTDAQVSSWNTHRVGFWLQEEGFDKYTSLFQEHQIDGTVLLLINERDLIDNLHITTFGDVKKLIVRLDALRELDSKRKINLGVSSKLASAHQEDFVSRWIIPIVESKLLFVTIPKTMLSIFYVAVATFTTGFTMTFVHERVPDQQNYPPLPDIFLDNIQMMPWAFAAVEYIILFCSFLFLALLFFHKHRLTIYHRFCVIAGTIFLLRCLTLSVTSLSVPATHLKCDEKEYLTFEEKLIRTWKIISGLGLSIQGVRTCGDYMFSGHTSMLTTFNYFLQEYTPHDWKGFHLMCWTLNFLGCFFVLAAHEHYSIDVLIAFFVSSRLFLYYHSLVHTIHLTGHSVDRIRSFFPMFSYMEQGNELIQGNDFEIPFISTASSTSRKHHHE